MRPIHFLALTVVVASSSIAPRTWAQGALVRVSHDGACCRSPLVGTLVTATADSLWIRPEGARSSTAPVVIARGSVRELERGELLGAHRMVGAGLGLLAGTVVGGVVGTANACTHCDGMGGLGVAVATVTGGLIGILTGTVIGSMIPHYVWQRDDVPQRVGFTVGSGGTMQVGGSLRF
jgi:hypothetical protein